MSVIQKHWIFNQASYDQAKLAEKKVIAKFKSQFPYAMDIFSDGLEDALQFFHIDKLPHGRQSFKKKAA